MADRKLGQDALPAAVEVSVYYQDRQGQPQVLKRLINVPVYF